MRWCLHFMLSKAARKLTPTHEWRQLVETSGIGQELWNKAELVNSVAYCSQRIKPDTANHLPKTNA